MRALFGLVGILVTVGVIVWFLSSTGGDYLQTVGEKKVTMEEQASQIAGRDINSGRPASESARLDLITSGGRPDSVLVTSVEPGGAYERFYGLRRDDAILSMGPLSVRDNVSSLDDARAYLMDAYQRQQQIVVIRSGEKVTLPQQPPQQPAPAAGSGSQDPLQQQLDGIGARRGL